MEKYQAILVVGAPGVGKSTYSKEIVKDGGYFIFSTGDMFRNLNPKTEMGAKAKEIMDRGDLVDDETVVKLAKETLQRFAQEGKFDPEKDVLLLDGIPRTLAQVEMVKDFIEVKQVVSYFVEDEQIMVDRIMSRGEGRSDDTDEEIIRKRIQKYNEATAPILRKYPQEILIKLDASRTITEVVEELKEKIYRRN